MMVTTFLLSSFQLAFVGSFLVLAGLLALVFKARRLVLVAALFVGILLLVHYGLPVIQTFALSSHR